MEFDQGNLRLIEINIRNFIYFSSMDLSFHRNCTTLTGKGHLDGKSAIIKAIEFIVSKKFLDPHLALSLKKQTTVYEEGFVKLKFEYKEKSEVKILEAWRTFTSINLIFYHFGNERYTAPVGKFQLIFNLNKFLIQPYFDFNIENDIEHDNLLNFLDESTNKFLQIFSNNLEIVLKYENPESKIAIEQQYQILEMEIENKWDLMKKLEISINEIIRYITYDKYEIYFTFENDEQGSDLCTKTLVRNSFDQSEMLWKKVESYLKFLIKVSVKIAVAINFNQKFIFFENMNWLEEKQNFEFFQFSLLKNDYNYVWKEIYNREQVNYLQRMINIFNQLNMIAFFEYRYAMCINDCNMIECQLQDNIPICKSIIDYEDDDDLLSYFE